MAAQLNPLKQVSLSIGAPVDGVVPVTVGNNTYYMSLQDILTIWNDRDEQTMRKMIVFQCGLLLQQAGVNPTTASFATSQAAIQAGKVWI